MPSRRTARSALAALGVTALVAVATAPALAAGTGGIEVTPLTTGSGGRAATAFHVDLRESGTTRVAFALRNITTGERRGRVYVASAQRSSTGEYDVGRAGSSPYVSWPEQQVTLSAGEARRETFTVGLHGHDLPKQQVYAAVVVEVANGAVVQRAATLIYLKPVRGLHLPRGLVVVAVALLLASAVTLVVVRQRA